MDGNDQLSWSHGEGSQELRLRATRHYVVMSESNLSNQWLNGSLNRASQDAGAASEKYEEIDG